ncbi:MAG: hypothetical protein P1U58_02800 [Verrucomicrobiales bacterium]|nr:hypothetical protein [Verrucomicrobiales bacterium]
MPTVFTRAKAASKVIELFESRCGIPRSKINCDARLESDLGVYGDDVWELLDLIESSGVDMTEFDCHDWISREGLPVLPMLAWLLAISAFSFALLMLLPAWPDWITLTIAFLGAVVTAWLVSLALPRSEHEEIRVRDLVLSVEAGRWKSPKTGNLLNR